MVWNVSDSGLFKYTVEHMMDNKFSGYAKEYGSFDWTLALECESL